MKIFYISLGTQGLNDFPKILVGMLFRKVLLTEEILIWFASATIVVLVKPLGISVCLC